MRRLNGGWTTLMLAMALAVPSIAGMNTAQAAKAKAEATAGAATGGTANLSKEEQDKLKEHNKLRAEIKKVKYPAAKGDVVSHIKGVKADDKKWVESTLADKTYNSADEVYSALGWETTPAEGAAAAAPAATGATGATGATNTNTAKTTKPAK